MSLGTLDLNLLVSLKALLQADPVVAQQATYFRDLVQRAARSATGQA